MRYLGLALALLLGGGVARADIATLPVQSFAPVIEKTAPAVVNIYARKVIRSRSASRHFEASPIWQLFRDTLLFGYGRDRIQNSLGSGVIVRADGVIVTNAHVVDNAEGIFVALVDGSAYPAQVILSDKRTDLAVLRILAGELLPTIELADSDRLKVGDPILAIGNPFGLGQTVTSGIVSALARTGFGAGDYRYFIQTDAAINPGNSGGAQITMEGKLSGINTAIFSTSGGSQGLGFAIPSNMVRTVVASAVEGTPLVRPWIGISGRAVFWGVEVTGIYAGGPGHLAGIQIGDAITAVDGFPVDDPQALRYRVATRMMGNPIRLRVVRQNRMAEVEVTPLPPPDVPPRDDLRLPPLSPLRGAKVASLSPALAEDLGLDSSLTGVVVLDVATASAASRRGLQSGDIIGTLDGKTVRTSSDLAAYRITPFEIWTIGLIRGGETIIIANPGAKRMAR